MLKGKGGYIMVAYAFLLALNVSQEKKVKKLLDHGKPVLLTELGDGKNDVFVMPKETDDGILLENVYGNDILVGEEETTIQPHKNGLKLYQHNLTFEDSSQLKYVIVIISTFSTEITSENIEQLMGNDGYTNSALFRDNIIKIHSIDFGKLIVTCGWYSGQLYKQTITNAGVISEYEADSDVTAFVGDVVSEL